MKNSYFELSNPKGAKRKTGGMYMFYAELKILFECKSSTPDTIWRVYYNDKEDVINTLRHLYCVEVLQKDSSKYKEYIYKVNIYKENILK